MREAFSQWLSNRNSIFKRHCHFVAAFGRSGKRSWTSSQAMFLQPTQDAQCSLPQNWWEVKAYDMYGM